MDQIQVINVLSQEQLETLGSALTFEGCDTSKKNLEWLFNWLEERTEVKNKRVYVTKGKQMNAWYNLTGINAYNDDLSIVSVDLKDLGSSSKIIIDRFDIGGHWLDDIITNNLSRDVNEYTY